jgi:hypothetical protein
MIGVIITLIVIGVLLYVLETMIPMDATIKRIIYIVVILAVLLWLLQVFGVYDFPAPRLRRAL